MSSAETDQGTRERLLEAACDVFAEKGYRDATNRDICRRAGANVAAVNYYFGSKEALYAEAWRRAFQDIQQKHPPDGGVPSDAPPEERLRGRVSALIHQIADEENQAFLMVHRERAAPTPLLGEMQRKCLKPVIEAITALMRDLLGPGVPERRVHFCVASTLSQCVDVMGHLRQSEIREDKKLPGPLEEHLSEDIDEYVDHVTEFSLAGIRALRKRFSGDATEAAADGGGT